MIERREPNATAAQKARAEEWDRVVAGLHGHALQTSAWGRLKERYGWVAHRLAVGGAAPRAAALLLVRRVRGLGVGYVPRGPAGDLTDSSSLSDLLQETERLARELRLAFIRLEPDCLEDQASYDWRAMGYRASPDHLQPRGSIHVPLSEPESMLARMKPKTRYNIRLAERRGVQVRIAETATEALRFGEMMQATGRRDGFGVHPPAYYADAWTEFRAADACVLLLASFEGQDIAGLLVTGFGREACYLYGASLDRFREHMPNHLLQWRAMQWAAERGCERYDLWGIPDGASDAETRADGKHLNVRDGMWGVYRFKQGFGGEPVRYVGAFDRVLNPVAYTAWRWLRRGRNS